MPNVKKGFFGRLYRITAFIIIISMLYSTTYPISFANEDGVNTVTTGSIGSDKGDTVTTGGIGDDKANMITLGAIGYNGTTTVTVGGADGTYGTLSQVFGDGSLRGDLIVKVQADLTENQEISVDPLRFTSVTIESSDPDVNRGFSSIPQIAFNGVPATLKRMGTVNNKVLIIGGGTAVSDPGDPNTIIPSVNVTVENCKFKNLVGSQDASVAGDINLTCSGLDTNITVVYGGIGLNAVEAEASVGGNINLSIKEGTYDSIYGISNVTRALNAGEHSTKNRKLTVEGNVTTSVSDANVKLLCGQGAMRGILSANGYIGIEMSTKGKTVVNITNSTIQYVYGGMFNQVSQGGSGVAPLYYVMECHLSDVEINVTNSTIRADLEALHHTIVDISESIFKFSQTGNAVVTIKNSTIEGSLLGGLSTGNGSIEYRIEGTSKINKKLIGNTLDPTKGNADIYNPVTAGNSVRLNTDTGITVSALGGFTDLSLGGTITVTGDQDRQYNNIDIVDSSAAKISVKNLQNWSDGNGLIVSTAADAPALVESSFTKGWTGEKPVIQFRGAGKPGGWYLHDIPEMMVTVTFDPTPGSIQNVTGHRVLNYVRGTTLLAADIPTATTTAVNTHFVGWYTDINNDNTKLSTAHLPVINTNITYYAKWQQDSGGGSGGGGSGSIGGASQETPSAIREHPAYIKGYPDGTFRPDNPMTRAEVAAMFYQLLTDKTGISYDRFSDVDRNAWYGEAVTVLHSKDILKGYEDGTFRPESYITRAEFAMVVSRYQSLKAGSKEFSDVPVSYWAYDSITAAAEKGIINGYPDGAFRPERSISRAEAVSMTNRALDRRPDQGFLDRTDQLKRFSDLWNSHWAYYEVMESSNGHVYTEKDGLEVWKSLK